MSLLISGEPAQKEEMNGTNGNRKEGKIGVDNVTDENSLSLSRSGKEDRGDDKDENSSSAEGGKREKKPEASIFIEKGSFVSMPVGPDGQERKYPQAVKFREQNIIEKLREVKAQANVKEEDVEVRNKLNEILVKVVNNNRYDLYFSLFCCCLSFNFLTLEIVIYRILRIDAKLSATNGRPEGANKVRLQASR
jgi:hypothetical protein